VQEEGKERERERESATENRCEITRNAKTNRNGVMKKKLSSLSLSLSKQELIRLIKK
jgi:hypothetical protein